MTPGDVSHVRPDFEAGRLAVRAPRLAAGALTAAATLFLAGVGTAAPFVCPKTGGDATVAIEAKTGAMDPHTGNSTSLRNIAFNVFESLMTRDENLSPIPELADRVTESADHLTYTFALRQGATFHNGKPLTSKDVAASFNRYAKVGFGRDTLSKVDRWETPDDHTFVVRMKMVHPTFIDELSSYVAPIVIIPAEQENAPAQRLEPIGTGPFQIVDSSPGNYFKLKRYERYRPNTNYEDRNGYSGYKVACLDTVTVRMVTEPGARVAGLETGEFMAVEDLPPTSGKALQSNSKITLQPLENWWIQSSVPNTSFPPTDKLAFRKAVQAALDMDEIMDAATDGFYKLNVGFLNPTQAEYTDAGKEFYNIKNPALVKKYLAEAGYKGEQVTLLTNKDYSSMYKAALVMAEQLKSYGINARVEAVDWPTSMNRQEREDTGWNFFYHAFATSASLGAVPAMKLLAPPVSMYHPKNGAADPDLVDAFQKMQTEIDPAARQAAFVRMQRLALERAYAFPFGTLTKLQAARFNFKGFKPYRTMRFYNVWIDG